ncbi:MAG: DUF1801 domain-containing protein [Gemmatimonadetes bacterium]|nr:DUF1801 domain-containing protein [Gemmatimonadota bacterium]MDA1103448.1 DUF1801 domain-containing protein [Gemmatimonadota bacterium]
MRSEAKTVRQYLDELAPARREAIEAVREVVLKALPPGYEEVMNWGMIAYQVPLAVYPDTYNDQPLLYAALASQKNHMAVYLSAVYTDDGARDRFESAYRASGKRYDVGKSCVRFKKLDDLPLDVIGDAIGSVPMETFVSSYERGRDVRREKST